MLAVNRRGLLRSVSYRRVGCNERPLRVCAVIRRRFPVGASPTRRFAPAGSNRPSLLGLLLELAVTDRHVDSHSAAPEALRRFPTLTAGSTAKGAQAIRCLSRRYMTESSQSSRCRRGRRCSGFRALRSARLPTGSRPPLDPIFSTALGRKPWMTGGGKLL